MNAKDQDLHILSINELMNITPNCHATKFADKADISMKFSNCEDPQPSLDSNHDSGERNLIAITRCCRACEVEYHRGKDESIVTIGGCPVQPVHTLPKGCMQVAAEVGADIVSCQHSQQVILLGALPPHGWRHPGLSLRLLYRRQRVVPVHNHWGIALSRPANGSHLSYRCVPMRCFAGSLQSLLPQKAPLLHCRALLR